MSFYHNHKINDKYVLTDHSRRRIKERLYGNENVTESKLLKHLELILDDLVIVHECDKTGDIKLMNYEYNIKIITTNKNVIKTIIKK